MELSTGLKARSRTAARASKPGHVDREIQEQPGAGEACSDDENRHTPFRLEPDIAGGVVSSRRERRGALGLLHERVCRAENCAQDAQRVRA